jgi:hypothetical protein
VEHGRVRTIISNTDMDSDRGNSENEFRCIHFSVDISNRVRESDDHIYILAVTNSDISDNRIPLSIFSRLAHVCMISKKETWLQGRTGLAASRLMTRGRC